MEDKTKERIEKRISELADEERKKMISSGKPKTEERMVKAIAKAVYNEYDPEEFIALVMPTAQRKLRNNMKAHGWSAALANSKQHDAFPEGLEDSAISIAGQAVRFGSAESPIMKQVIRAQIDNDIKQKKAYTRNMETLLPLDSLMEELGCTAEEAMEILREREEP